MIENPVAKNLEILGQLIVMVHFLYHGVPTNLNSETIREPATPSTTIALKSFSSQIQYIVDVLTFFLRYAPLTNIGNSKRQSCLDVRSHGLKASLNLPIICEIFHVEQHPCVHVIDTIIPIAQNASINKTDEQATGSNISVNLYLTILALLHRTSHDVPERVANLHQNRLVHTYRWSRRNSITTGNEVEVIGTCVRDHSPQNVISILSLISHERRERQTNRLSHSEL
jgi:hypothetical protein